MPMLSKVKQTMTPYYPNWPTTAALLLTLTTGCTTTTTAPTFTLPKETSSPPAQPAEPAPQVAQASPLYTVTRIYDGDTLDAFKDGQTIKVRLACIDAPETDQAPHGQTSRQLLDRLARGQVRLNVVDEDRYGRLVAEMYSPSGDFINRQLVAAGQAVVYRQYLDSCGGNGANLLAAEQEARAGGRGVWADPRFVMPWDHRQGERAEPAPEATPAQTAGLPACASSDCDCGDFSSWDEAQAVLESAAGDPHGLDGDGDRVACEGLR